MAPAAGAGPIAYIRLGRAFLARQALADGVVGRAVVLVLDGPQPGQRDGFLDPAMPQGEFAGEMVEFGIGVVAPHADLGVVHQPAAGGEVGLHPLEHGAFAADVEEDGQDLLAMRLQVQAQPSRSVRALEAEGLHAFAGGGVGRGLAQTLAQRLADQAGGGNLQQFGEGAIRLDDGELAVQHGHGHRQGRETQAEGPAARGVLGDVQPCHHGRIAPSG